MGLKKKLNSISEYEVEENSCIKISALEYEIKNFASYLHKNTLYITGGKICKSTIGPKTFIPTKESLKLNLTLADDGTL
jgi:hypothetical protein